MTEILVFYKVSSSDRDGFFEYNLNGSNLLNVAEQEAKDQTKNQNTRFIHRHSLECIKTLKVEDQPRETTLGKHVCEFEACNETQRKTYNDNFDHYCWLHTGLNWYTRKRSDMLQRKEGDLKYFVPEMGKAKALKLLKQLVAAYDDIEGYTPAEEKRRAALFEALKAAKVLRIDDMDYESRSKETLKDLIVGLVEGGKLA